ncbi:MAG: HD domain-containing protein [archaeon]|nr:MAG: HD domain-containing protein [archaeon]
MEPIKILETKLSDLYKDNSCEHDLGHVLRVLKLAKTIGKKEGADLFILLPAVMLHDIALKKGTLPENNDKHAVLGSEMAKNILEECGFKEEKIDKICSTIKQHSLDNPTDEPRTIEGDCLFDADKLDSITSCGFARYLQEQALEKNTNPLEASKIFIDFLKDFEFRTQTGKEMGRDRSEAIKFCQKIIESGELC